MTFYGQLLGTHQLPPPPPKKKILIFMPTFKDPSGPPPPPKKKYFKHLLEIYTFYVFMCVPFAVA